MTIGQTQLSDIGTALRSTGIGIRLGPYEFCLRSPMEEIADAVQTLHAHHAFRPPAPPADFTLDFQPERRSLRRWVICSVDGKIWHSWPARLTVAAMEWITSWCYFRSPWNRLAIHAAAAVHPESGQALVFPGHSGAGKSTLSSTLMLSGWTLLSDEISLIDTSDLTVFGLGRPTILKGASLDLIRERFLDNAKFGPAGRVLDPPLEIAHLQPTQASVQASGASFQVGAFVFPRRSEVGPSKPQLHRLAAKDLFVSISQLGINYRQLGEQGFRVGLELSQTRPAFELHYRDASEAEAFLKNCPELSLSNPSLVRSIAPATVAAEIVSPRRPGDEAAKIRPASFIQGTGIDCQAFDAQAAKQLPLGHLVAHINEAMTMPEVCLNWNMEHWSRVLPLANHMELLPQLAAGWSTLADQDQLPRPVRERVRREVHLSEFNCASLLYELNQVRCILADLPSPLVLLKGCAYLLAEQRWASGRRTNDVDLLIDETQVDAAAEMLLANDFCVDENLSSEDRRYYRRWLHELPPVKHRHRKIEVDLHFRLLPVSDPCSFETSEFSRRSVAIPGSGYRWLDPIDRVIHSCINLGHTGEFRRAFRDLWDIRYMIESDVDVPFDWEALSERSCDCRIECTVARMLLLGQQCVGLDMPTGWCKSVTGRTAESIRKGRLYRMMLAAALPDGKVYRSSRRRAARWMLEHYPLPRLRTWVDPLTWTKRVAFIQGK